MRSAIVFGIAAIFVGCGSPFIELRPRDAGVARGDGGVLPRLYVANVGSSSVAGWNSADALAADTRPDFELPVAGLVTLTSTADRLVVAQDGGVLIYDGPRSLQAGASPAATISASAFPSAGDVSEVVISGGALWVVYGPRGAVARLDGVATLSSGSTPGAYVVDMFNAFAGLAHDPVSDRLFGGQRSRNALLLYKAASTKTGTITLFDVVVAKLVQPYVVVAGDSLISTAPQDTTLNVWVGLASLEGTTPANMTISTGFTLVQKLSVQHDVLVVCGATATASGAVALYEAASGLTSRPAAPTTPDQLITHPSLGPVFAAALGTDHTLYAVDADGVSIFKNATTGPAFVTEITSGVAAPHEVVLVE